MESKIHTPGRNALTDIRNEWYAGFGCVVGIILVSFFTQHLWIPILEAVCAVGLVVYNRSLNHDHNRPCGRLIRIFSTSMALTALVSFMINVLYRSELIHRFFPEETVNDSIPFVTSLVIFPIITILSVVSWSPAVSKHHAYHCRLHNEYNPSQPWYSPMIHGAYRRIIRFLALVCLALSAVEWTYYFLFYININFNSPDRFFFFVIPTAAFVGSIFYVRSHFSVVKLPSGKTLDSTHQGDSGSRNLAYLRYLVIHNDCLLLNNSATEIMDCNVDTPAIITISHSGAVSEAEAKQQFTKLSGCKAFNIKELYNTANPNRNVLINLYLVEIPDSEDVNKSAGFRLDGEWITLDWIDRYMKMGVLAPRLAEEFVRIYTMSMAWKTYHRNGLRLYPIRNYRPTFRLRDIFNWDVDYNDKHWFKVARHNQDSRLWPFLKLTYTK